CFSSSRGRHTRCYRDWSSDLCSSDLFANPAGAHVYGMASPLDLEGRSLAEFVGEADAEGFADRMVQARRGGWAGELVLRRGEGELGRASGRESAGELGASDAG